MTVWIYVDTSYFVGHPDHIKAFADPEAAERWFNENDPEGVAFEYDVLERYGAYTARRSGEISCE